jgi:hypothetical protein
VRRRAPDPQGTGLHNWSTVAALPSRSDAWGVGVGWTKTAAGGRPLGRVRQEFLPWPSYPVELLLPSFNRSSAVLLFDGNGLIAVSLGLYRYMISTVSTLASVHDEVYSLSLGNQKF